MESLTLVLVLAFSVGLTTSAGVVRVDPQAKDDSVDSPTLQRLLCVTNGDLSNTIFVLSTTGIHWITAGAPCLIQRVHNLTIMATPHSNKPAIIQCTVNQNTTQQKLTIFASSEIRLSNVAFTDCGDMFINPRPEGYGSRFVILSIYLSVNRATESSAQVFAPVKVRTG